jgi:hypothetical protein
MQAKTPIRIEFLTDILTCAIENYGYGAFEVLKYKWRDVPAPFADITFGEDDEPADKIYHVTADTIAHGLGVIRKHAPEIVGLSFDNYKMILKANAENDASDIDTVLALAILECALFGKVVYC